MLYIIVLFIVCAGGGYWLSTSIFDLFFGVNKNETYIDRSIHHHYHKHEHKNISIIDDRTKEKIFELEESKKVK